LLHIRPNPAIHPRMWSYSARDVAKMLDLSIGQVRGYVQAGLVDARRGGRGELLFSFQDLVLLRTARGLKAARVPPPRIRKALKRLRAQLPHGRSLAGVHVAADGRDVVVREGGALWKPSSGQCLFDFEVAEVAERIAPLLKEARRPSAEAQLSADDWYAWGC